MKLTLHPGAERDLAEAAAFYEREGSPALAARFILEFKRASQRIVEHPELGASRANGRRGLRLDIFPYTVIYRVDAGSVRILVVMHQSRHPKHGSDRR